MWPRSSSNLKYLKQFLILAVILASTLAVTADFVLQFYDDEYFFTSLVDSLIGSAALLSVIYTASCFLIKKYEIQRLTQKLKIFEEYLSNDMIVDTEKKAEFYTKIFIFYGIIGNIFYACLPLLSYNECLENRSEHMIKYGIPCGPVAKYVLPFKHDVFPLAQLIILEEALACTLGTTIVMTVTMLVCGILIHISTNLKHLRKMILDISHVPKNKIETHVNICVKYHTDIIEISDEINNAFSSMMLVHITWTSFIISVLGAEILLESNYWNSFRFTMHLGGWLGMLFLVCFYGQTLINDSIDISKAVYESKWYKKSPSVRRSLVLMLLRSQRPLVLKAAGINIMSLETFLNVMYAAYSYFTILLNMTR